MHRGIISICGGSGCGKTFLAVRLAERLGLERAVRIPTDYYLKPNPYPTLAAFFQHPLEYDWELLDAVLAAADGTARSTPVFDFVNFRRLSERGGRAFTVRPIAITDAMVPHPSANLTVLVRCPEEERKRRIIERDQRWNTSVIDYWGLHQRTLADMLRTNPRFDLEIDGMDAVEGSLERVISLLGQ